MASNNKTQIIVEPGKQELFVIREFDAPRELVFKAFSTEEILVQWVGPREMTLRYEKFEPREGGSYRFINGLPNGMEFGFHGVCHEFTAPERIIQTFEFEGLPEKGHVVLETTRLEELPGGRTKLTVQSVFQSVADRDGMVASGMERGVVDSYERLDEFIEKGVLSFSTNEL
ncbi:SRPBCC family protein [Dyadobacter bucti]|uniref:SRPBCC family protein n=1 Tax=Dyadobacter bucti TaxID=2572203 RepID=UPI001109C40F|nr:SRPBCC family protein [Dyadobacter bucti]